jgi:hypothetical protein
MSLSREAIQEGKEYLRGNLFMHFRSSLILENCSQLFGHKFFECRVIAACQLCTKGDKFESRYLVISKFRIFIIHGKNPHSFKLERNFHLLSLRSLIFNNDKELNLSYEDKAKNTIKLHYRSEDVLPCDLVRDILVC